MYDYNDNWPNSQFVNLLIQFNYSTNLACMSTHLVSPPIPCLHDPLHGESLYVHVQLCKSRKPFISHFLFVYVHYIYTHSIHVHIGVGLNCNKCLHSEKYSNQNILHKYFDEYFAQIFKSKYFAISVCTVKNIQIKIFCTVKNQMLSDIG